MTELAQTIEQLTAELGYVVIGSYVERTIGSMIPYHCPEWSSDPFNQILKECAWRISAAATADEYIHYCRRAGTDPGEPFPPGSHFYRIEACD